MQDSRESLSLVSLNIEGRRHIDRVTKFLKTSGADAILLQEVFRPDALFLAQALDMDHIYAPMSRRRPVKEASLEDWGITMLSPHPLRGRVGYYGGDPSHLPELETGPKGEPLVHALRALITGRVEKEGTSYDLATTHFSWTPNGEASALQRQDAKSLLKLLSDTPEVVLAGDFNAPRGGEIYHTFCRYYLDRLPAHVKTTIDGKFHRAGFLQLVVDHLFTSPGYEVSGVHLVDDLSDHWGILARIHKVRDRDLFRTEAG